MDLLVPQPLAPQPSTVGFDIGDDIVREVLALASCVEAVASAPGCFRRDMPDPIPVVLPPRKPVATISLWGLFPYLSTTPPS
jgi:hypothetical protein